jgi:hypothetical protein
VWQARPRIQLFGTGHELRREDVKQAETLDAKRLPDFAEADLSA